MEPRTQSQTTEGELVFAAYFALQAAVGALLWIVYGLSATARSGLELQPGDPHVTVAFAYPDAVVVAASLLAARALRRRSPWASLFMAATAGALLYSSAYLLGWVALEDRGELPLAVMLPPTTLSCWITYLHWAERARSHSRAA